MNLRTQLKDTKMRKGESIQDYFTRISQIKENLSSIGDILDEDEFVMTSLNGLTRPWDSFIVWSLTLCGKIAYKKNLEYQALAFHTKERKQSNFKKSNHKPSKKKFQKKKKDYSKYQCYNCHKIGHIVREWPSPKNNKNKRHHAHLAEDEDEERPRKKTRGEDVEEYGLFSALSRSVTPGVDIMRIDCGASKHMIGKKTTMSNIEEKNSS